MPVPGPTGYALNRTRHSYLAKDVRVADTHWSRFIGLMGRNSGSFPSGQALWIIPCRGVHTFAMRFAIDVVYLDSDKIVVHMEENLKPWRMAPLRLRAASVLELPGHTLSSTQTAVGDEIEIQLGQAGRD